MNHFYDASVDFRSSFYDNRFRFVLIACDGLWKTFSNQQAVDYVMAKVRQLTKVCIFKYIIRSVSSFGFDILLLF